jgi:hypothetical protein
VHITLTQSLLLVSCCVLYNILLNNSIIHKHNKFFNKKSLLMYYHSFISTDFVTCFEHSGSSSSDTLQEEYVMVIKLFDNMNPYQLMCSISSCYVPLSNCNTVILKTKLKLRLRQITIKM